MTRLPHTQPISGWVSEIFASHQGEGHWLGAPQIFIRFAGCPLHCRWCDTPEALAFQPPTCTIHTPDGRTETWDNPLDVTAVIRAVEAWRESGWPLHSASLTGGEPLAQHEFLSAVLFALKARGVATYLETAGVHHQHLPDVLPDVDYIAMDVKLPGSTGMAPCWDAHERFLPLTQGTPTVVKLVVTRDTTDDEIRRAITLVHRSHPEAGLIFQPVTPTGEAFPPSQDQLQRWKIWAMERLTAVSIIPQVHRLIGIR